MKLRALATTVLFTAISLSVHAGDAKDMKEIAPMAPPPSDAGFYIGAYGGTQFASEYGNHRNVLSAGGANLDLDTTIHSGWGGAGGIKGGYRFDSDPIGGGFALQPAVEAEAFYLGQNSHATYTSGALPPGTFLKDTVSYNSADFFVNGILRLKTPSIVTPYIGLGIGGQYITTHVGATTSGTTKLTGMGGSDLDFAVQALGGFDVKIAEHWDLFSEYKFVDALGTNIKSPDVIGSGIDYRFKPDQIGQHVITAGIKYSF